MDIDVIAFELGSGSYAIELRFVHEVVTLGYVTQLPLAPASIIGACNVRGKMVPVIDLEAILGSRQSRTTARPGTTAVLVEADEALAALPVRRVIDVELVPLSRYEVGGQGSGPLIPGTLRGTKGSIPLLDVASALRRVATQTQEADAVMLRRGERTP